MIPIKIKNKSYKIKSIDELTTKEFIELSKIEDLDFVKYISWATQTQIKDAFFAVISKTVEQAIGTMPDIRKMKRHPNFDYTKLIQTVGQRHQIESCNLEGYELLVFILAVAMAQSTNIDDVNKLVEFYNDQSFKEILPAGFFFFKILQPGNRKGTAFLKNLLFLTKIRKQKSRPDQIV